MKRVILLLAVLLLPLLKSRAQETLTLRLMSSQTSRLTLDTPSETWLYSAPNSRSTVVVEPISGTLDPLLDVLNSEGVVVASNNDFAPTFSPAARLTLPAGENYTLRVSAAFGEGDYRITALPGAMHRQWDDDFAAPNPYWLITNATPVPEGVQLQTPLTSTRLFTPLSAPALSDVYLQARFRFDEVRAESNAGLAVRSRLESNGQVSGVRLEVTPAGAWTFLNNDGLGTETILANGTLTAMGASIELGLLAQGDQIAAFADGIQLAEAQATQFAERTGWGVVIYDARIILEDFWLASPAIAPPSYPIHLNTWASSQTMEIGAELIAAGVLPPGSERVFVIPSTDYTVNGVEQRNFLLTDAAVTFDNFAIGGTVVIREGVDVGCGLVGRFNSRDDKILSFADTQLGAGLVWWERGAVNVNDYSLVNAPNAAENRLLLILNDHFVTLYVNGDLTAQALIPLRRGNVGVGFVNYTDTPATCQFKDVWIWQ